MGLNFMRSSSSFETPSKSIIHTIIERIKPNKPLPNPRADNYSVLRSEAVNGRLVIEIRYHDCTNYEGRKIMLYECSLEDLMSQKLIDPHFCDSTKYLSPIARFEPTERGWVNAKTLARSL